MTSADTERNRDDLDDLASVEEEARERVAEIRGFYTHFLMYVLVNAMLVGIYLATGGGYFWPIFPLMGWGIGLAAHASTTFGFFGMFDSTWEERKVREFMLQKQHGVSADEVRRMLKQEMATERRTTSPTDDVSRINKRLENLEAIVTSRDWDELQESGRLSSSLDEDDPARSSAQDADRLAKRVR